MARSRDDWDFYERAGERFASVELHISDTISHPILSLQEFVVKKLGGFLPCWVKKIDFFFFALSDRYTFQELSQKYLSRNL